jgi:hypothetical protein
LFRLLKSKVSGERPRLVAYCWGRFAAAAYGNRSRLAMASDEEFLLYPLDAGEDPACSSCAETMARSVHEIRNGKLDFLTFSARGAGEQKST